MNNNRTIYLFMFLCILLLGGTQGCKEKEIFGVDPYAGGKEALGIAFIGDYSDPESGVPGAKVTFDVKGLKKWEQSLTFYINEEAAEVVSLTDSTITVIVPEEVSTGGASVRVDGQVFFGPRFEVEGKVNVDKNYAVVNGTNYQINDAIQQNNNLIIVGGFTDFEKTATTSKPINRIAAIGNDGKLSTSFNFGKGSNGTINSILRLSNGQYIIAGAFSGYHNDLGIQNITRINNDGKIDTTIIEVVNLTPDKEKNGLDTVPTFNGGVYGNIRNVFLHNDPIKGEGIVAIGNFHQYGRYYYPRATREFRPVDITNIRNVIRMDIDGNIDSSYAFQKESNSAFAAANGLINGAHMLSNKKLVIVGSFTSFHGKPANRIVCLDEEGLIDETFNSAGANNAITSIEYHKESNTFLVVGQFTQYQGVSVNGIARIHADGTLDTSFKFRSIEGGMPTYAKQLSSGKILVTGTFEKYNGVVRRGMLILESDGEAKQEYNSFGAFSGIVNRVIEGTSSNGFPSIILMGFIQKFNDQPVHNILKIELEN